MAQLKLLSHHSFLNRLWIFAKPYRYLLFFSFVFMCIGTWISLLPSYLIISLTNSILVPIQNGQTILNEEVHYYLGCFLGAALFTWLMTWCRTYLLAYVSEKIGANLRTKTFNHLLELSLEYFNQKRMGDLISRIGSESDRINIFISVHLLDFIQDIMMIGMILGFIFYINAKLAIYALIPLPFIFLLTYLLKNRLNFGFEQCNRVWSQLISILSDVIHGIRVVKCFGQEPKEKYRFQQANEKNVYVNNQMNKIWSAFSPTSNFFNDIGVLIIWGLGIHMMTLHEITLGGLTGFIAYLVRLYSRFESMTRFFEQQKRASASIKRIFEILDKQPNIYIEKNPKKISHIQGELELKNVNFAYDNHQVLFNLNLLIKPGERIGFVGHSGAGKTTLMNLICRFYDPTSGEIKLDGTNIQKYSLHDYRKNIGVVLQDSFLFYGTIAENIAYSRPDASFDEIVAAAKAANSHEFILRQPLGYDTIVQEGGISLSGGEKQRISIARAILNDAKILILDEATSAVDAYTEKEIQNALENLTQNKTTLVISHRLSSLRNFDKLVVIQQGKIIEVGSHAELIQNQGYYADFYQMHQNLNMDTLS
ncbi:MAG: ABC transporter ATP-binding protein [Gammaproteobacteria bacterium]|nr:ABC transporter ATP-binding protein [Gammaproteobacteria bacterium]